jgi:hypothetical protein
MSDTNYGALAYRAAPDEWTVAHTSDRTTFRNCATGHGTYVRVQE